MNQPDGDVSTRGLEQTRVKEKKYSVLLISIGRLPWYRKGERLFFFYTPRLGLPSLAAVTPPHWEVSILDGVQPEDVETDVQVDLVGFSILTPFALQSYRIADAFRARGVSVVFGGVHPTLIPDEAAEHADAVVVGEGEPVWQEILRDHERGCLASRYEAVAYPSPVSLPVPRFDVIQNRDAYAVANAIQLVRGCPYGSHCPFCIVPKLFGSRYRMLPPDEAIKRIRAQQETEGVTGVNVSACCPLNHTDYIKSFCDAIQPLAIEWCGAALLERLDDPALIDQLRTAGCTCVYTESEVVSPRKNKQRYLACRSAAKRLHEAGIAVSYNFTVGLDGDDEHFLEEILAFIEETGIPKELCAVQCFAPWPATNAFERLRAQDRLRHQDWDRYDNTHVVFSPARMRVDELEAILGRPR